MTPEELADYEFCERVAILIEANHWSERAALAAARRWRDGR